MNKEKFVEVYNLTRNGANGFYRHPFVRNFAYSDGVRDLAETGIYWLLDVLATELPPEFEHNKEVSNTCLVKVRVEDGVANIWAEFEDGVVAWGRGSIHTDMPEGSWDFYVADEGGWSPDARYRMILLSEW